MIFLDFSTFKIVTIVIFIEIMENVKWLSDYPAFWLSNYLTTWLSISPTIRLSNYLPKALSIKSEAELSLRSERFREIFENFKCENCDNDGSQKSNLNKAQQTGLKSLLKKIKNNDIIICRTDKTGKLVVLDHATYIEISVGWNWWDLPLLSTPRVYKIPIRTVDTSKVVWTECTDLDTAIYFDVMS